MNKIKKTFLKEKENDYKLRNPKIFSKYVIVLSKNNPNIKFTFIDIVFFLIVIFYISLNYDSLIAMIETFGMLFSTPILFINEFFHGLELKSYEFDKYKSRKKKETFNIK